MWISIPEMLEEKKPASAAFDVLRLIVRLKPVASVEQAKADLSIIACNLASQPIPYTNKQYRSSRHRRA